jgi:hypothetical protein
MIEELEYSNGVGRTRVGEDEEGTNQRTLFPDPATEPRDGQVSSHSAVEE